MRLSASSGEIFRIHLAQDHLNLTIGELGNVVKDEHLVAHFLGQFRILGIESFENRFFGGTTRAVEDFSHCFRSADFCDLTCQNRLEFCGQRFLQLAQHLRRNILHLGNPERNIGLKLFRETVDHTC